MFKTSKQWLEHVKHVHAGREWHCSTAMHSPLKFYDENSFRAHMKSAHIGSFNNSQLDTITRINSRPISQPFETCPFCGRGPFPDDYPKLEAQVQTARSDLPRHIASHLESLAMLALLPRDDRETTANDPSASNGETRLSMQSDGPSLDFSGLERQPPVIEDPQWIWGGESAGFFASHDHMSDQPSGTSLFRCNTIPNAATIIDYNWISKDVEVDFGKREEEWGFTRWTSNEEYGGHYVDPTLANFHEKLNIS
jgi:hypothetical protein